MYNDILDGDSFHNDDIKDEGRALNAVRFVSIDYESAAARNLGYLRERITRELAYQEKQALCDNPVIGEYADWPS